MAIDMSRLSAGVQLRPTVTRDIWAEALDSSAVASLVPSIQMPGAGLEIDVITGDPEAEWVGETEEKPVGIHTFGTKTLKPYKMALIEIFSDEFRRDKNALYREISSRLPKALGRLLDKTVLYGTAPGENFDVLSDVPVQKLGTTAQIGDNVLAINAAIAAAGHALSGWALSPQGKAAMIGAKDSGGALLFSQDYTQSISLPRILGEPVYVSKAMYRGAVAADPGATPPVEASDPVVGLAGDWSQARLGIVERIKMKATTDATVNKDGQQINLWQRNMFGILVEMEVGFVVNDKNAFVRLTK
jgi:HK97 family phage major capsid protein